MIDSRVSKKLTFFSLAFSIGMVVYHSLGAIGAEKIVCNTEIEKFFAAGVDNIRCILGGITMNYFFFTSAFLLYYNIDDSNWKKKVSSRVMSLGFPYLIWNLPLIVLQLIKRGDIFNIRFLMRRVFLYPFIGPSWYLLGLLLLLISVPIYMYINKVCGDKRVHAVICILIVLTIQYLGNMDLYIFSTDFSDWLFKLIGYAPTYLIGMYCGLYYEEYYMTLEKNRLILIAMFGTGLFSMLNGNGNSAISILFVFACWYLSDCFIDRINTEKFIFRCAFPIFMGHDFILNRLAVVYNILRQIRGYFLLPMYLVNTLIAVGSIYIFAVALDRYCPRLLRLMTGSRFYRK